MRGRTVGVAFLVTVAIGVSGCGGDGGDAGDDAAAATVEQIDEICAAWQEELGGREFPVDDFDPESPAPGDLPAVGAFFEPAITAQEKVLSSIGELSVPESLTNRVTALTDAVSDALEVTRAQVEAGRASDASAFVATLANAKASSEAVNEAADALGADSCVIS